MVDLRDPDKPAGWVEMIDGKPVRNDGVVLTPAEENPWYVLMTIAGEPEHLFDHETIDANRRYWNGLVSRQLKEHYSSFHESIFGAPPTEDSFLEPSDYQEIGERFRERMSKNPDALPSIEQPIHLNNFFFEKVFTLEGFYILADLTLENSVFAKDTNFAAYYGRNADFSKVQFGGIADFGRARFNMNAYFQDGIFTGIASFKDCKFGSPVEFDNCEFWGATSFWECQFTSPTSFLGSKFKKDVPQFFDCDFHQSTIFSTQNSMRAVHWPPTDNLNAEKMKDKYVALAKTMSELQKSDEEQFFRRQELRCNMANLKHPHRLMYTAYGLFSDFGYSVLRPLAWLTFVVTIGWIFLGGHLQSAMGLAGTTGIWQGLGASFSNTFAVFRFGGIYFEKEFFEGLPTYLKLLGATQTILGVVFLFFLGLGLRNRFRLK